MDLPAPLSRGVRSWGLSPHLPVCELPLPTLTAQGLAIPQTEHPLSSMPRVIHRCCLNVGSFVDMGANQDAARFYTNNKGYYFFFTEEEIWDQRG